MINPIELIQEYKDQGFSCEEAAKHRESKERTALTVQDRHKVNL